MVTDNTIGFIYLKLIGPDGKIITQPGVVSGNLTMPSTTLPQTGTYELVLDPYQQRTGTARVEVRNE